MYKYTYNAYIWVQAKPCLTISMLPVVKYWLKNSEITFESREKKIFLVKSLSIDLVFTYLYINKHLLPFMQTSIY